MTAELPLLHGIEDFSSVARHLFMRIIEPGFFIYFQVSLVF